jgi:HSP20 family protein
MARGYQNPMYPLRQLRSEMDRLLTGFMGQRPEWWPEWTVPTAYRGQPAINVWETGDAVIVESEVPGLKNDQLEISVAGDELTLKIDRPDTVEEGATYHRRERPVGSFTRLVRLPSEVNADAVQAELHDGVLTISLPKAASAKPRKIQVAAAK